MAQSRRASLVAVLLLLASAATASAECAWVLWAEMDVASFDQLGRPDRAEHGWQIVLGSSDEQLCWKGAFEKAKEAGSRPAPAVPGFPGLMSTVDAGTNSVKLMYRHPADGTVVFVSTARWVCLPDTVDPRGPKGK